MQWFINSVINPFRDFMTRGNWVIILLFVVLYKFGDALVSVVANPFYIEMGFSKIEIANVSKIFGLAATLGFFSNKRLKRFFIFFFFILLNLV